MSHLRKRQAIKGRDRIAIRRRKRWLSQDWRSRRFCYVFGGIGRESYTISWSTTAKLLIRTFTSTTGPSEGRNRPEAVSSQCERGIVFHSDNARSHTSTVARQKLRKLSWEVLMHPPYSPDRAPRHLAPAITTCSCPSFSPISLRVSIRVALWN